MEFASQLKDQSAGNYEASQIGWSGRVDPDGNLHQFVTTGGGINDSKYSNPTVDELLNAARTSTTRPTRKATTTRRGDPGRGPADHLPVPPAVDLGDGEQDAGIRAPIPTA